MDELEIERVSNIVMQRLLLRMPEVVGNLMRSVALKKKLGTQLFHDHPDFVAHKQLVMKVIESVEGKDVTKDYSDVIQEAIPIIQRQIGLVDGINMTSIKPNSHAVPRKIVDDLNGVL